MSSGVRNTGLLILTLSLIAAQVTPAAFRSRRRSSERKLDHTKLRMQPKNTTTTLNSARVKGVINYHGNQ